MTDNEILKAKINDVEWDKVKISAAATRPNQKSSYGSGISAQGTKEIFNAPSELIKERHNLLVEGLAYIGEEERARQSAEKARQSAEETRQSAEGIRIIEETTRANQEDARQFEEAIRQSIEAERQFKEAERQSMETERQFKEAERQSMETERQSKEAERQSKEAERQSGYTEMQRLIGHIDSALTSILKTQSALIGGNSNDI